MKTLKDVNFNQRRVLLREDLNTPLKNGNVSSDIRLLAAIPTIELLVSSGAQVILMSHLGRPQEGLYDEAFSLKPIALRLSELLGMEVPLITDYKELFSKESKYHSSKVVLLENVRFNKGEKSNCPKLAKEYSRLADIFVMDAFATAHRAQASTEGVIHHIPSFCGPLLEKEINALQSVMLTPKKPLIAVIGGSKVSTKLEVLTNLLVHTDVLIPGGGIANTFLAAEGFNVGRSLYEKELLDIALKLMQKSKILLPIDVVVTDHFDFEGRVGQVDVKAVNEVSDNDIIVDIGPKSIEEYSQVISKALTILWNGPVGIFEIPQFASGTKAVSVAIVNSHAFSVAGGGDTLAAIDSFGVQQAISQISTGGGAFLEYIEGRPLPVIEALKVKHN